MQKYDFIKKQYTPYTPPQNGHCDIMVHANEELNCAACGVCGHPERYWHWLSDLQKLL